MREPWPHAVGLSRIATQVVERRRQASAELRARLSDAGLVGSEEKRAEGLAHDVRRHSVDAFRVPALESRTGRGGVNELEQSWNHHTGIADVQIMGRLPEEFGHVARKTERAVDGQDGG